MSQGSQGMSQGSQGIIVASSWVFCITLPTLMMHGQTEIRNTYLEITAQNIVF